MKKKGIISVTGIILFLILGYCIYQKFYTPILISLPDGSAILSIEVINETNTKKYKEIEKIDSIIQCLSDSELTKKTSVQDVPLVRNYTSVILNLVNKECITLYVYKENGNYFVELPYQGIYKMRKFHNSNHLYCK